MFPAHIIQSLDDAPRVAQPRFPIYGWLGLVVIAIGYVLLFLQLDPWRCWFFVFAWYGYILFADACVWRFEGASLIRSRFRQFLVMLPLSTTVWVVFEGFNLRLGNWEYQNLVNPLWVRLIGFAAAFATVFPGIFETADLLRPLAIRREWRLLGWRLPRWRMTIRGEAIGAMLGLACLLLSLLWPRYCFPLVWLGFVPLLEPFNRRLGVPSLYKDLERGDPRRIILLLLGGFICGGLWEFWNYWAYSRWVYHVPFVQYLKLFEMPLLGFFGFPPFALECFSMYHFLVGIGRPRGDS
ncbi:MAG: hypothetical protein NTW86_00905 [Candidatus Sumerlaeota bacterium]|nr:hypothetical protein [Candidatus Sumerlaeota bacterium]